MSNGFSRCVKFSFLPLTGLRFRIPINHIHVTAYQMQVAKGDCVGALTKVNNSSGQKKSKRLSKEERKGMVQAFLKRHQESNNGTFPSLQLTHKEVGGSYYVVREIFQELIQKKRVLAPPKLPAGEEKTDDLVNGSSDVTMENEEFVEAKHMELVKGRVLEGDKDEIEEVEPCEGQKSQLSEDVVVEASLQESTDENTASGSQYSDSNGSSSSLQHSNFKETTTNTNGTVQNQTVDGTLNKISSDSCEAAASKESVSQETNPIVSFMKTVAAYVKFWS